MAGKKSKNKQQPKQTDAWQARRTRTLQIVFVVFYYLVRELAPDDPERLEGSILRCVCVVHKTEIHVVAHAQVKCQARCDFPVVLKITRELLRALAQIESRVSAREKDVSNYANTIQVGLRTIQRISKSRTGNRSRSNLGGMESLWKLARVLCDLSCVEVEVIFRRRVESKESTEFGYVGEVAAEFETVVAAIP